jgi:Tfp pilus assembly protein PilE
MIISKQHNDLMIKFDTMMNRFYENNKNKTNKSTKNIKTTNSNNTNTTNNINTQRDYISRVEQEELKIVALTKTPDNICNVAKVNSCKLLPSNFIHRPGKANVFGRKREECHIVKDLSGDSKSQSLYVLQLTRKCYENDIIEFTHNTQRAPLPGN